MGIVSIIGDAVAPLGDWLMILGSLGLGIGAMLLIIRTGWRLMRQMIDDSHESHAYWMDSLSRADREPDDRAY